MFSETEKQILIDGLNVYFKKTGSDLFLPSLLDSPEISPANQRVIVQAIEKILSKRDPLLNRSLLKKIKTRVARDLKNNIVDTESGPLFPEAILGFRSWGTVEKETDVFLTSMFNHLSVFGYRDLWSPGLNTATCHGGNKPGSVFPHKGHECGFNAFHSLEDANDFRGNFRSLLIHPDQFVLGSALGAGQVQIHKTGWRSEKAAPLALLWPKKLVIPGQGRQLEAISEKYSVPIFKNEKDFLSFSFEKGEVKKKTVG